MSYALNDLAGEYNVPNIFWGCSVEEDSYKDARMVEDYNKYSAVSLTVRVAMRNF